VADQADEFPQELRLLIDEGVERGGRDDQQFAIDDGAGVVHTRRVHQQRYLAKPLPRFDHAQHGFAAACRRCADADPAALQVEQRVRRRAVGKEHVALGQAPASCMGAQQGRQLLR